MKITAVLFLSLTVLMTLSCATPQSKGSFNLVASARNSNLNGFGEITRRVIHPKLHAPMSGANDLPMDTKLGAATDRSGTYKISNITPGTYTIKVAFIGYTSIEHQVQVEENRTIVLDFNLVPEDLNPDIHYLPFQTKIIKLKI